MPTRTGAQPSLAPALAGLALIVAMTLSLPTANPSPTGITTSAASIGPTPDGTSVCSLAAANALSTLSSSLATAAGSVAVLGAGVPAEPPEQANASIARAGMETRPRRNMAMGFPEG